MSKHYANFGTLSYCAAILCISGAAPVRMLQVTSCARNAWLLVTPVGDEYGLLAKKMWCTTVPVAPPGGEENTNYCFSRFFVRAVPLFRSLMLTPMTFSSIVLHPKFHYPHIKLMMPLFVAIPYFGSIFTLSTVMCQRLLN